MNFFSKTRLLIGAVILLAAINIATLGTIGYHFYKTPKELPPKPPRETQHTKFIANELNLDPEQRQVFRDLREQFLNEIQLVKVDIRNTNKQTMKELSNDSPNDHILDSLANEIARLHRKHHEITIEHFKKVKQVATPEQQEHIKRMFYRMMDRDQMDQHRKVRQERRIDRYREKKQ